MIAQTNWMGAAVSGLPQEYVNFHWYVQKEHDKRSKIVKHDFPTIYDTKIKTVWIFWKCMCGCTILNCLTYYHFCTDMLCPVGWGLDGMFHVLYSLTPSTGTSSICCICHTHNTITHWRYNVRLLYLTPMCGPLYAPALSPLWYPVSCLLS